VRLLLLLLYAFKLMIPNRLAFDMCCGPICEKAYEFITQPFPDKNPIIVNEKNGLLGRQQQELLLLRLLFGFPDSVEIAAQIESSHSDVLRITHNSPDRCTMCDAVSHSHRAPRAFKAFSGAKALH